MASELSGLLRTVRIDAGCSQLELALRLDVSQRHVNFIERDRARPSRSLLLAWLREVGSSTSLANAALLNAGYAPLPPATRLPASPTRCDEVALRTIALHHPNPGHVFDADWNIVQANPAGRWLCDVVMPGVWEGDRLDMLASLADPRGWLSCARAPEKIAAALLGQLRAEQWTRPSLRPRIDALAKVLESRYGCLDLPVQRDALATSFDVTLDTRLGVLSFCAVQTVGGLPHDATGTRLRAELWYPTDMHTACLLRQRAENVDEPAQRMTSSAEPRCAEVAGSVPRQQMGCGIARPDTVQQHDRTRRVVAAKGQDLLVGLRKVPAAGLLHAGEFDDHEETGELTVHDHGVVAVHEKPVAGDGPG